MARTPGQMGNIVNLGFLLFELLKGKLYSFVSSMDLFLFMMNYLQNLLCELNVVCLLFGEPSLCWVLRAFYRG